MGERRVCISRQRKMRAKEEGERACSTRVSLIAFISKRGVRSLLSDIITQASARRRNTGNIASTHTHTHNPWFISLLNNSLLFSRPPLLGPQLPFDLSTPPPATSIHFYLRADALYPVLPFFFFFIPFVLLFFGPHPLGIIIDWRDTCSYLLGSSQRKNSSFDESISIVSFFFFYFSCSIVDREIAYRWENLRIIFILNIITYPNWDTF